MSPLKQYLSKPILLPLLASAGLVGGGCLADAPVDSYRQGIVSGAGFTTDNIWVDGDSKEICKNSSVNCNIYGAKSYVWLNGGPAANGLGPDGDYFFSVLVPGGQPDPNDGGAKNLSDDYDAYTNRTFTITDGEVSAYSGTHDQDSGNFLDPSRRPCRGNGSCSPDGEPPLLRLAPYADTTNPGGVYIMAICSLADGYPVEPRDCKYDAFKVQEGEASYEFLLTGMKFEDTGKDGDCGDSVEDPGIPDWSITIQGTGFTGEAIDVTVTTDGNGYWSYGAGYTLGRHTAVQAAELTVCEVMQEGWVQTFPESVCYDVVLEPSALAATDGLDFGNYFEEPEDCPETVAY